ncbi:MAG: ATP-binding protein [Bacteroidia bacterium]
MIFIFGISQAAYSQSFSARLYPAFFNNQNWEVWDVAQLLNGQVWVATDGGLAEFKGREFVYAEFGSDWGSVFQLSLTGDTSLWVLAETGIYQFWPSSIDSAIRTELILSGNFTSDDQVFVDKNNRLWLTSSNQTLCLGSPADRNVQKIHNGPLFILNGPEGSIGAISPDGKVYALDSTLQLQLLYESEELQNTQSVCAISSERVLVGGANLSELIWDLKRQSFALNKIDEEVENVNSIISLDSSRVLLNTPEGIYRGNWDKGEWYLDPVFNQFDHHKLEPLPFDNIHHFSLNEQGQVWVAAENGLGLMYTPFFTNVPQLMNTDAWGLTSAGPDRMYINVSETFEINRTHRNYNIRKLPFDFEGIYTAISHSVEGLWVANMDGHLFLNQPDGQEKQWDFSDRGGVIFHLYRIWENEVWVCQAPQNTPLQGIMRVYASGKTQVYGAEEGLNNRLLCLKLGYDEQLYAGGIGAETYLFRYDAAKDSFINLSLPLPFSSTNSFEVHEIDVDQEGNIWMASTDGLLKYDGQTISHIKVGNWPLGLEIRSLRITRENEFWFSSNQLGIMYWKDDTFVHFGEDSGLPVEQMSYRGLNIDEEGYLWAITDEGLVVSRNPYPKPTPCPTPKWDHVEIDQEPFTISNDQFPNASFSSEVLLKFSTPIFPATGIQYQGRVLSRNSPWIDLDPREGWRLSNLTAGRYELQLRARHKMGTDWSKPLSYWISVKPVWYKRAWATVLFILLGTSFVVGGILIRNQRLKVANKRLEKIVQERTEKLEEALEVKSLFMANMSHEIRTPMHGVLGTLDLLADTSLSLEQKDYVSIINQSSQTLLAIINDILDLSKAESGKMELEAISFNLRDCIEQVLLTFASKAASKSLELTYELAVEVPLFLVGDKVRIGQILSNLVSNAIKFTHQGGVHIGIFVQDQQQKQETDLLSILIRVSDTGIGIPLEKQAHLFEAFSQVDTSTTRKYGGTGLGLTIVKHLVNLMGGEIKVQSEHGAGTSFSFELQLAKALPKSTEKKQSPKTIVGKQSLLLAPPSRTRDWLSNQLKSWELSLQIVESFDQAKEYLTQNKPDFQIVMASCLKDDSTGTQGFDDPSIPTLVIAPINEVRQLRLRKQEWISQIIPMPIRYQSLLDWLTLEEHGSLNKIETQNEDSTEEIIQSSLFKILLAEDNMVNKKMILKIFEKIGYPDVDWVGNGQDAVEAVKTKSYDLVFMDVQMPKLDGLSATRLIRASAEIEHQPTIIALTANAMKSDRLACKEAGMDDFLPKPFRKPELSSILVKWTKILTPLTA